MHCGYVSLQIIKDYSCPHCDYATSHKSNLERHKRIHERLRCDDEDDENSQTYIDVEQINDHATDDMLGINLTTEHRPRCL
jgi:peptide subunit release factor 1 (eRF1)